ncbi:MAG: hypothetical protein A2W90_07035 [Bacteroidetes bacterium GWF2_42_66]|nr:MAG: hypothetical protein A2W92_01625 [Bacteroidetes bacterium GWA2_42_15]OFY02897.1 MAG: hypothetical protein A2W89_24440 [Bacteroidetes bacterium GWE2_42_39]OFY44552.1 MAG: hypothetical protein A2W90_07035 [Bacteroidetes bacterium GWF2_42_66]HBL74890.1 hypothetical protein [Prolixibacteraceae bacterium]HCR91739.1 hypothetical protein [Prolixibacteraceae bacterium]
MIYFFEPSSNIVKLLLKRKRTETIFSEQIVKKDYIRRNYQEIRFLRDQEVANTQLPISD